MQDQSARVQLLRISAELIPAVIPEVKARTAWLRYSRAQVKSNLVVSSTVEQ